MRHSPTRVLLSFVLGALVALSSGCSSATKKHDEELAAKDRQIEGLNGQVTDLKTELKAVSDKLDAMQMLFENATHMKKPQTSGVKSHPAEVRGKPVGTKLSKNDPEAGFVRDEPIQAFRRAVVLFEAGKSPEALLAFTTFLEKHPDHPVAGAAQYYIGKCYLVQKQYKAAITEFQRVLTSYDRSSHVSHTLRDLAEAEEATGNTEAAAKHRQLLNSLFPQSPAATIASSSPGSSPETGASELNGGIEGTPAARNPQINQTPATGSGSAGSSLDEPPTPEGGTPPTAPTSSGNGEASK